MGGFRQPQQPQQQQQQPGLDQQQQQMQNDMKRNARIYNDIPAAVLQSLVRLPAPVGLFLIQSHILTSRNDRLSCISIVCIASSHACMH